MRNECIKRYEYFLKDSDIFAVKRLILKSIIVHKNKIARCSAILLHE